MRSMRLSLVMIGIAGLAGCAHFIMRGSVVKKEGDNEAQVCLGKHEVKEGDRVLLFNTKCEPLPPTGAPRSNTFRGSQRLVGLDVCEKVRVGEGTVTRLLDEHMSLIKVAPGVNFERGTIVEKE